MVQSYIHYGTILHSLWYNLTFIMVQSYIHHGTILHSMTFKYCY